MKNTTDWNQRNHRLGVGGEECPDRGSMAWRPKSVFGKWDPREGISNHRPSWGEAGLELMGQYLTGSSSSGLH